MQIQASIWGGGVIFDNAFLLLTALGERRLVHWGFSLAGPNRFCNPTTALLIILIFIFIHILSILIILIIPIILIILIILFVFIIVLINSFLLSLLSSSSVSFIVLVSNLINIKKLALFVTCSNSKKPRETVAAFRLHLVNPPSRLPHYPSPASFRTSPLASSRVRLATFVATNSIGGKIELHHFKKWEWVKTYYCILFPYLGE